MEAVSIIITIISILAHIIPKLSEGSSSNSNVGHSYMDDSNYRVMSSEEKLSNMKIDEIDTCYKSAKIQNYSLAWAEQLLISDQIKGFEVVDVFIRYRCIYIKAKHSIPYNTGFNEFSTSMSINYIEVNNNVIVYGFNTYNGNEKDAFECIANEIITELSR
jgi:hypothetical protein